MPKPSPAYRKLNRAVGKALHGYRMISDGDRILVGVSGGADSLSLMQLLSDRLRHIPVAYDLTAVFVDPGFENGFTDELEAYCRCAGFAFRVEYTDFGVQAHSRANPENPCFLCARLRRKRLFELADALGCNKIALGHNKDDIIETLFLNICYAGEISTMLPRQSFFGGTLEIIRPLACADQKLIRSYAHHQRLPSFENPCPSAKTSRRRHIKNLLEGLYASNPKIKGNIFKAIHHVKPDYLLKLHKPSG